MGAITCLARSSIFPDISGRIERTRALVPSRSSSSKSFAHFSKPCKAKERTQCRAIDRRNALGAMRHCKDEHGKIGRHNPISKKRNCISYGAKQEGNNMRQHTIFRPINKKQNGRGKPSLPPLQILLQMSLSLSSAALFPLTVRSSDWFLTRTGWLQSFMSP